MGSSPAAHTMRGSALVGLLVLSAGLPTLTPRIGRAERPAKPACVINSIWNETTIEKTRVILHANTMIDYRGGALHGRQIVLDLANVEIRLPTPIVELSAPEVDRVVIGPEISRDGERILKVRLLGVRASSQKVETKGNELYIDLTPIKGARDGHKGMPKLIDNSSEVMAGARRRGDSRFFDQGLR